MEQIKWPASVSAHINLGLFSDNQGLLRCRGRFHHSSSMESTAKFPYYLSEKSHLAKLLVLEYHMKLHHVGPSVVIAEMRRQYWIPCLRQLVRHTIYFNKGTKCLPCFIMQLKPFIPPPEPPLPSIRVDIGRPFQNTGLDYFGPYYIRVSGQVKKAYGLIFSCLKTRAIHCELTSDMTADRTILAIRRFIARRGKPDAFLSDNAKQFILSRVIIERT